MSRAVMFLLLLCLGASSAVAGGVVFLVRTGTDAEGNPMFRQADSRDTYLSGMFNLTQNSSAINEAARYYDQVQKDKLAASLQAQGASAADIQYAMQNAPSEPVYVEVNGSNAGTYNDWKGRFTVQYANGQVATVSTPRVVFPLGGDVARSGDSSLIVQTLIHEIGHGGMCKCMLCQNLPNSPYLSKPHSGGSVTDPQLAFIEGWAEFIGTYFTGRRTIAQDAGNPIDNDTYARNSDGSFKNAQQLVSTEGWVATVLYHVSVAGKNQNAMWKMTQAMSRANPQDAWSLLQATAQMFPELAPTINQVVAQDSGGQIPGVTAYASNAAQQGYGAYGGQGYGAYAAAGQPQTASPPMGQGAQLASAMYTGDPNAQYAGYQQYAAYQQAGGAGTLAGVNADTAQLQQMYAAKQQELNNVPWWKFWEKSKIKQELSMIEDVYSRQSDLSAAYTGSGAPSGYVPQQSAAAPGSAAAPNTSYTSVLDAMRSNDTAAAQASMNAYRAADAARRAAAAAGPSSER